MAGPSISISGRIGGLVLAVAAVLAPCVCAAEVSLTSACAGLTSMSGASLHVDSAVWIDAGPIAEPTGSTAGPFPGHCRVRGETAEHTDARGRHFGVRFELRLPQIWNGRFFFQGGGGLDGSVQPAVGVVNGGPPALARGFAVLSMDGGHEGQDASFASDQQARLDFAYQAIGKAEVAAKRLIQAYYGRPIAKSYFVGCSNGGREAMIAAQRYPLDFDGVVAGAPGFRLSRAAIQEAWANAHYASLAPVDARGQPDLTRGITEADLQLVVAAVKEDCDALDGLKDGLISNPAACHFSPRRLACSAARGAPCLSPAKVAVLEAVFGGAKDSAGHALYSRFFWDTGIDQSGWRVWTLGLAGASPALNVILGGPALSDYFMTPAEPSRSPFSLDFDTAVEAVSQTGAINDATSTLLNSFAGHGGKLLIYHGVSDPVFSAADTAAWYDALRAQDAQAPSYARLFLVPGMNHCSGGIAADRFDTLSAIVDWVEKGQAPDALIATGTALPGVSRPLCAYPAYARYRGGPADSAPSFSCVVDQASK